MKIRLQRGGLHPRPKGWGISPHNHNKLKPKPDPESMYYLCKELNVLPKNILMVGDSIADINLGKNTNCQTIVVKTGNYIDTEFLKEADYVVESIDSILE